MGTRLPILKLALVVTTLLAVAVLSAGQDAGVSAAKKPYARTGYEATLSGTITLTGKRPKPVRIDMSADPVCYEANSDPTTEWVMGNKGKLANVLVYVKGEELDKYAFELPLSPAVLEHKGCRYIPHVLGMRVGQHLTILNSDPTTHNNHPTPRNNREFNQTQPPLGFPLEKIFHHLISCLSRTISIPGSKPMLVCSRIRSSRLVMSWVTTE